jgi:XTP/dITP diphosphohydrolase
MKRLEKIVVATRNPGKKERYEKVLAKMAGRVLSLEDLGIKEKPEEVGKTAEENAVIKAKFYAKKSGLLLLPQTIKECFFTRPQK